MHAHRYIRVVALLVALALTACSQARSSGKPYFFESFTGTEEPLHLVSEVSAERAKELESQGYAYYVGSFDDTGRPAWSEKHFRGSLEWRSDYIYAGSALAKVVRTDSSGKRTVVPPPSGP